MRCYNIYIKKTNEFEFLQSIQKFIESRRGTKEGPELREWISEEKYSIAIMYFNSDN